MKNVLFKGMTLVCLAGVMHACSTKQNDTVVIDKEQIKKEIQAKEDSFAAVYNSGELKEIGYYADDAVTYFQNREPLIGKPAIIAFMKNDIRANSNKISFQTKEVFVSSDGAQVVEIGAFRVVDSTGGTLNTGNYMSLFEKRNGRYVAVRDMSASDMYLD